MKNRVGLYTCYLIGLLLASQFLSSCEENNDAGSGEVQLLSFGPSGTKPGGKIKFIGQNLDKVTAIELPGVTVQSSAFLSHTKELIEIEVPLNVNEGYVTLQTSQGEIVSKTQLSFEVAVVVHSFTASAKPGENITISGEYLNWVRTVIFAKDSAVSEFESQSVNELVVKVPLGAETGPLTIVYGGTNPLSVETEENLEVALPALTDFAPNPVKRDENLVINGTDLDLVKAVVFKGADPVMDFVNQSTGKLTLAIPEGANKGKITLMAFSGILIESEETLTFVGDLPDLPPLGYAFYEDALQNNWQNWGWGSTVDLESTENVRQGEASAKLTFNGSWGALKLANSTVELADYTELGFALFGAEGTDGKTFDISINDGEAYKVTIKEGEWVEYNIPFVDLGPPKEIGTLVFQETGWAGTVYFDHVGLR